MQLMDGMRLTVTTKPDERNPGKWAVATVKLAAAAPPAPPPRPGYGKPAAAMLASGKPEEGFVGEWHIDRGFGFVNLDDGRRAYIHRAAFGGNGDLIVGQRITVTVKPDARNPGKICVDQVSYVEGENGHLAMGVKVQQEESPNTAMYGGGAFQGAGEATDGHVSEWREDKGFGFINLDDGRRAYVHRSAFGGAGDLVAGQR